MNKLQSSKSLRASRITRLERVARAQGFTTIAGVDEAGRGPLAGPVVAAACILPEDFYHEHIDDSKRLSPQQREAMFGVLTTHPGICYGIGTMDHFMIDQMNILQATLHAMAAAIAQLQHAPDFVLIDGHHKPLIAHPCQAVVKGDTLSQSIMAAAIIAKVTRDRQMVEYDRQFPHYGFALHKGYPTPQHLAALDKWGPCSIHRCSYAPVKQRMQT